MDFHSLARKELQTLCKRNKIPANMTNVAMADALTALEIVEGLDEFMNPSQSPEKAITESPSIPRTVNRTSTRRKPIKGDPESAQPTTRTRRTTRRTLNKDLDQENQNVNVVETPAVPASRRRAPAASASKKMDTEVKDNVGQEMSFVFETETPVVQTGRRKAQVGSTRRKVEKESVQVYSTRRSVRLLEKTLAELSLKEEVRTEPVKMDVLDEVQEKNVSAGSLKMTNDSEVSSSESFLQSLENERELNEDVHEEEKSNGVGAENCEVGTQNSVNLGNVLVVDSNGDNHDETADESDGLLGGNSNKANTSEMGLVDIPETEFISETENASIEVMEPEEPLAAKTSDEISAQVVEDVVPVPTEADQKDLKALPEHQISSEKNSEADSGHSVVTDSEAAQSNMQIAVECVEKESVHLDNVAATDSFDDQNFGTDDEFDTEDELFDVQLIESEVPISYENKAPKMDNIEIEKADFDTEGLIDVNLIEAGVPLSDEDNTLKFDNLNVAKEEFNTKEIDADLTEAEVSISYKSKTPKSVKQLSPASTLPIDSTSGDKTPSNHPVSGPFGADSFSTQFPRPTQSTPKQSSSKKQATAQKLTLTAINKENIDTSGMQLESKNENDKVKKTKNITEEDSLQKSLNEKSLRELNKMLKEKLQITNKKKNNEEQNVTKQQEQQVGKARLALRALPENLMLAGESKKEN